MIRKLLFTSILLVCAILLEAQNKPNIVFILADDLGWGDLSCYGHPYSKTPEIDKLASQGTRFKRFYVTGVTCCPSRTGFMTSRHPASYSKYMDPNGFDGRPTLTQIFNENGYTTGHFGKWHIGNDKKKNVVPEGTYGIDDLNVIGTNTSSPGGRDADLFQAATKFIEQNKDKPFYVNIWGHISHYAVDPLNSLVEPFNDVQVKRSDFGYNMQEQFDECESLGGNIEQNMRNYLGDVYSLDIQVGRLLKKLDELGLAENTIVIFSSDQGPAPVIVPSHEAQGQYDIVGENTGVIPSQNMLGCSGVLRGRKHTQYEGGVRTPFIIRWPGHFLANTVDSTSIVSGLDYLPTICSLAGISIANEEFEGENMADVWQGSNRQRNTGLFWRPSSVNGKASMLEGNWKLHEKGEDYELYDLSVDVEELNNVAQQYPEKLKELKNKMENWVSTLPKTYIKEWVEPEVNVDTSFKAEPLQHLDASVDSLIVTDADNIVSSWNDRSNNGYKSSPKNGEAIYPSSKTFTNGLSGIDFRNSAVSMELFSAEESDIILDQVTHPTGFCILAAVYIESIIDNQNDIIGNSSSIGSGFLMRYSNSGKLQASLGGVKTSGSKVIDPKHLVIFSFNYNADKGVYDYLCSATGEDLTGNVVAADFSNDAPLTIGSTTSSTRYFDGMVGEVLVYNTSVPKGNLWKMMEDLEQKWKVVAPDTQKPSKPLNLQVIPVSFHQLDLSWDASTDNVDVAGYTLYRDGIEIEQLNATTYRDTGLNEESSYNYYVVAFDGANNLSDASETISASTLALPDGIENLPADDNGMVMYPNPTKGQTFVSIQNTSETNFIFELYTEDGKLMKSEKLEFFGKKVEHQFDFSNLKNGIYIYQFTGSTFNYSGSIYLNK